MSAGAPMGCWSTRAKQSLPSIWTRNPTQSSRCWSVSMITGGTGITSMLQVIHAIMKDPSDCTVSPAVCQPDQGHCAAARAGETEEQTFRTLQALVHGGQSPGSLGLQPGLHEWGDDPGPPPIPGGGASDADVWTPAHEPIYLPGPCGPPQGVLLCLLMDGPRPLGPPAFTVPCLHPLVLPLFITTTFPHISCCG